MQIEIDGVKQNQREEQRQAPPQFAIVAHATPAATRSLVASLSFLHVLVGHLSVPKAEAHQVLMTAASKGRAVVKPVTKDVGETLLADLNECPMSQSDDFQFTLEQV